MWQKSGSLTLVDVFEEKALLCTKLSMRNSNNSVETGILQNLFSCPHNLFLQLIPCQREKSRLHLLFCEYEQTREYFTLQLHRSSQRPRGIRSLEWGVLLIQVRVTQAQTGAVVSCSPSLVCTQINPASASHTESCLCVILDWYLKWGCRRTRT